MTTLIQQHRQDMYRQVHRTDYQLVLMMSSILCLIFCEITV